MAESIVVSKWKKVILCWDEHFYTSLNIFEDGSFPIKNSIQLKALVLNCRWLPKQPSESGKPLRPCLLDFSSTYMEFNKAGKVKEKSTKYGCHAPLFLNDMNAEQPRFNLICLNTSVNLKLCFLFLILFLAFYNPIS